MSKERQNKGYEKPFFQPMNNQTNFWSWIGRTQDKINTCRKAKRKK